MERDCRFHIVVARRRNRRILQQLPPPGGLLLLDWYTLKRFPFLLWQTATIPRPPTASPVIASHIDPTTARFEANMRFLADMVSQVRNEEEHIREGGGSKSHRKPAHQGPAYRPRAHSLLVDPGTFFELGPMRRMACTRSGAAPRRRVVTGLARVHTRLVMIIANDATVKAGAFFPMTAKKVIRAQNIAIENRIPTIYLVDSAGVFLPLQEDVFPDTDDFGRVFRNNAVMSAMGIPQIAAIMGMCVAGGGYLPVMCDHVLMTEGSGLVSGRSGAGAGGDWAEGFRRGTWRRGDALGYQRHGRLPRTQR